MTNNESARTPALEGFLARYPEYETTAALDVLRASDFSRLDDDGHVYLDYTGGGLYATRQIRAHAEFMTKGVYGNPHSGNPTSLEMTDHVEATRTRVLEFFNADPEIYTVIFTPNASGALKLVGESYPFRPGGCFALTADNHNSVNGIREFAHNKNSDTVYVPLSPAEMRLDLDALGTTLASEQWRGDKLLAFPAQSNYSGVKHDLGLVDQAHDMGWDVLVDYAAYAPTSRIDFSRVAADFASFSFYKMFGYPTGIGALIAKRDKLNKLDRPWFAGGTIQIASVLAWDHFMAHGEAAFEDGTVNYLMIPAVANGLDLLDEITMTTISTRIHCLTGYLLEQLQAITHDNGQPLVKVHGPRDTTDRGGTITASLFDPDGIPLRGARIEELAGSARISIRTGCFCNPGCGETAHELGEELLLDYFRRPTDMGFQELVAMVRAMTGKEISAIRISVGLATNLNDCNAMIEFLNGLLNKSADEVGMPGAQLHLRDTA